MIKKIILKNKLQQKNGQFCLLDVTNLQKKIKPVQGYTDRLGIEVAGFVMMGA